MRASKWLVAGAAAIVAVSAACGDEFDEGEGGSAPEVPCNEDPWICEPPLSCWVFPDYTFQCMNVGSTPAGEACETTLGSSECAPEHVCFATVEGSTIGICVALCDPTDPTKACEVGTCASVRYVRMDNGERLAPIWVCRPPT